jgi:hypothetical protein
VSPDRLRLYGPWACARRAVCEVFARTLRFVQAGNLINITAPWTLHDSDIDIFVRFETRCQHESVAANRAAVRLVEENCVLLCNAQRFPVGLFDSAIGGREVWPVLKISVELSPISLDFTDLQRLRKHNRKASVWRRSFLPLPLVVKINQGIHTLVQFPHCIE